METHTKYPVLLIHNNIAGSRPSIHEESDHREGMEKLEKYNKSPDFTEFVWPLRQFPTLQPIEQPAS